MCMSVRSLMLYMYSSSTLKEHYNSMTIFHDVRWQSQEEVAPGQMNWTSPACGNCCTQCKGTVYMALVSIERFLIQRKNEIYM